MLIVGDHCGIALVSSCAILLEYHLRACICPYWSTKALGITKRRFTEGLRCWPWTSHIAVEESQEASYFCYTMSADVLLILRRNVPVGTFLSRVQPIGRKRNMKWRRKVAKPLRHQQGDQKLNHRLGRGFLCCRQCGRNHRVQWSTTRFHRWELPWRRARTAPEAFGFFAATASSPSSGWVEVYDFVY